MSFCFCTNQKDVEKNIYEADRELGGGELPPSACPWVGNRPPKKKKKMQFPGGVPGGHGYKQNSTMHNKKG